MLCNIKWINVQIVIDQKKTVICSRYFPASSHLVCCLLFITMQMENNHDCLVVVQSLQYKSTSKYVLIGEKRLRATEGMGRRERESDQ